MLQITMTLEERLGKFGALVDKDDRVQLTAADRVQGAERKIILFLVVNGGAGFLFDLNRLNVISTRATDFHIIVRDRHVGVKAPEQSQTDAHTRPLREWIESLGRNRRVVVASTLEFHHQRKWKRVPLDYSSTILAPNSDSWR